MWFVENYRHLTYWQQMATTYDFWFVIQKHNVHRCPSSCRGSGGCLFADGGRSPGSQPLTLSEEERAEYGSDLSFVGAGYPNRRNLLSRLLSPEWTLQDLGKRVGRCTVSPYGSSSATHPVSIRTPA